MTIEQVAAELQLDLEKFQSKRWRLTRDHGFPRPLPGIGLRWSRKQVVSWIEAGGAVQANDEDPPPAPGATGVLRLIKDAQSALDERYNGSVA